MNFNSLEFAIFLPTVFVLYWIFGRFTLRFQNLFIILASFVFYGWVDYRFLGLIIFSILLDYFVGLSLAATDDDRRRRLYVSMSILGNLAMLCYFKYYNFFVDSMAAVVSIFGYHPEVQHLQIVLPLGISFYTFQTMSYSIDIYRRRMEATRDILAFGAFVSFFPQLVAGPIERAERLVPQFSRPRRFEYQQAVDGLRQVLWGFFKKVVIADSSARILNPIYENYETAFGSTLALAATLFALQVYADFSGYSDIAIGSARLFGIRLSMNFRYPFFSRNIGEFWNRWHISLSTWFRDYIYYPLGGSRRGQRITIRNIMIVFLISGFWHGASWTIVTWGLLSGLVQILYRFWPFGRVPDTSTARVYRRFMTIFTFVIPLVIFRSESFQQAFAIYAKIFSTSFFTIPQYSGRGFSMIVFALIFLFFVTEWRHRHDQHALEKMGLGWSRWWRFGLYYLLILIIFLFNGESIDFIYFHF